jgi:DNA topoisomerase-1
MGNKKASKPRSFPTKGKKVAEGKDFDPETGTLKKPDQVQTLSQEEAQELEAILKDGAWTVALRSQKKKTSKSPEPPFITSTLQQEGNRKLNLSARDTMRLAQKAL